MNNTIEIIPAVLRATWEGIQQDWAKVVDTAEHIQLDVTDGVFAGDGTFRDISTFKKLPQSQKIELHMMVHTPSNFVDDIVDLNPARCIFHLEAFEGTDDLPEVYATLREKTQTQLALALNPDSPTERLNDYLGLLDYVLFMGYNPGWAGQPVNPLVFNKIREFTARHPELPVAVDGHVGKDTIPRFVHAGARWLCANSAIFKAGDPGENIRQLALLAEQSLPQEHVG